MSSLVIQTAFLGDVVLTTPLLQALAERLGPVDVVTTPAAAPLLETHPAVRRVIPYDKRGAHRGLRALDGLARRLRAEGYDVAYLPHRSLRSALLAWRAGIPRRVGFHDGWPLLYTDVRRRPAGGHEIDRLLGLADAPPPAPPAPAAPARHGIMPQLTVTMADRNAAEQLLREAGIGDRFVALAPGSIWATKRWPGFADLAARLAPDVAVVALGGPEDAALGATVVAAARAAGGTATNACGMLTLRQSAALVGRAAALVTNDSAPLHLAQAVGTPTVAIFGPTVPAFGFGPRGPRDRVAELAGLACRPCHAHGPRRCPLGHHRCMRALRVDDVLRVLEETGALRCGD